MSLGISEVMKKLSLRGDQWRRGRSNPCPPKFTLDNSVLRCIQTRKATDEVGGFAKYVYLCNDNFAILNNSHSFELRRNGKKLATCAVNMSELWWVIAHMECEEKVEQREANDHDTHRFTNQGAFPVTFAANTYPKILQDGEPLFDDPPDVFQIYAECTLKKNYIEMTNIHAYHQSLFELPTYYYK